MSEYFSALRKQWYESYKGEASLKKNGKIWDNVPIRVDPLPPSDIWDIFEFETFLKNADPPLLIDLRHFWNWDYFDVD